MHVQPEVFATLDHDSHSGVRNLANSRCGHQLPKERGRDAPLRRLLERVRELDLLRLAARRAREAHVERLRLRLEARRERGRSFARRHRANAQGTVTVG